MVGKACSWVVLLGKPEGVVLWSGAGMSLRLHQCGQGGCRLVLGCGAGSAVVSLVAVVGKLGVGARSSWINFGWWFWAAPGWRCLVLAASWLGGRVCKLPEGPGSTLTRSVGSSSGMGVWSRHHAISPLGSPCGFQHPPPQKQHKEGWPWHWPTMNSTMGRPRRRAPAHA